MITVNLGTSAVATACTILAPSFDDAAGLIFSSHHEARYVL